MAKLLCDKVSYLVWLYEVTLRKISINSNENHSLFRKELVTGIGLTDQDSDYTELFF